MTGPTRDASAAKAGADVPDVADVPGVADVPDVADVSAPRAPTYELTLFVSGASALSARAVADARRLCDVQLAGRARLTVVDIHGDSDARAEQGVLVAPSLVRRLPLPVRTIVGDLSDPRKVLTTLGLDCGTGVAETRATAAGTMAG